MTHPKTEALLAKIAGAVRPMCINTSGELNEAGNHVITFTIPGVGIAIMELSESYAVNLACAIVEPFARAKGCDHG